MYKDLFHQLQIRAPLASGVQVTASGKIGNVLDRRDLDDPDGDLVGLIIVADAVATASAGNELQLELHEADEKSAADTLTNGAKAADADVLGYTEDGVRSVSANPDFDATKTETTQTEQPNLQDGVMPLINDTDQAGKAFWVAYRGYKNCVQVFAAETGTADATFTIIPVIASRQTRNLVNPA